MFEEVKTDYFVPQEMRIKAGKEVRDNFYITPAEEQTYIIVVAISKDKSKNSISRIHCKKGLPIGGYIYDSQSDAYQIECVDYLHLGFVPFSFVGRIKDVQHWEIRVPMPENVIKKYLNSLQKKELKHFKNLFRSDEHDIQFIQMIDPN